MALRIRLGNGTHPQSFWEGLVRFALYAALAVGLLFFAVTIFYYFRYEKIVDERLQKPLFASTAQIFAAPREVRPGQHLSAAEIERELREAGYTEEGNSTPSQLGTYRIAGRSAITIHPGPESYHSQDGATIQFSGGNVTSIADDKGQALSAYSLEPLLITGLSEGDNRTKRRIVTYNELPQHLIDAVVSIEDRRFFEHGGVDYWRILGAIRNDLLHKHKYMEGGSTLTMQAARGFFLTPEKKYTRKLKEILVTFQLEHRFSKQQIFEMYSNFVPLGQQGSFAINGFGEAAQAYFGKDVQQLNLSESALLAGMIQTPSKLNPYRHPELALARRNLVLDSMVETGKITKEEAETAKARGLDLAHLSVDAGEAPYFVDLVRDQLTQKLGERDYNHEALRIYTSLDPQLQRLATEAVEMGMSNVDDQVNKLHPHLKPGETITYPQVALVALNPHTGQVLAMVGGRNYGSSQLNHAVAKRPTGSIFKPFVYATGFNTSISGTIPSGMDKLFNALTMLNDEQTTYTVGSQEYTPRNYHGEYHEKVTARYALQMSLNNATISLADMVGFDNVAALARESGIKSARGTPAVAIGSYDATPMDMAGAYTVFANNGLHIDPWLLASIRSQNGDIISDSTPTTKNVLDPRAAYLTTNMMENVINSGTGYEVRRRGFTAPAAGKTGTSHDAWFAGFTSNLLCIVWVGNDDYTDVKIEGAHASAPIWAEFMKRAVLLPQYSDTHPFSPPAGVDLISIDKNTNLRATESCPDDFTAAFLEGTAPTDTCDHSTASGSNPITQGVVAVVDKVKDSLKSVFHH
jgi:penicillin-binding protein 1B